MNKNDQEYLIQKIRTQYTEKEHTELDALKELDRKVKTPPTAFAYTFGTFSALIMGSGMSLLMTDLSTILHIENPTVPGLVVGIVGMLMAISTYPLYKKMLTSRRKKYAPKIIALSEKI